MKKKSFLQKHAQYGGGMGVLTLDPIGSSCPEKSSNCYQITTMLPVVASGKVVDDQAMPLEGANIYMQNNTTKGTVTNQSGVYSLNSLQPSDNVVFSFIGFEQKVFRADSIPPVVQLMPTAEVLPGVTVTASTKKKLQIAGWALLGTLIIVAFIKRDKGDKEKKEPVKAEV